MRKLEEVVAIARQSAQRERAAGKAICGIEHLSTWRPSLMYASLWASGVQEHQLDAPPAAEPGHAFLAVACVSGRR